MADVKLFQGGRIKRLRREKGLTLARMSEELGISTGYLNLIERNQRPISAQVLLRLAEVYNLDVKAFSAEDGGRLFAGLGEAFADPLFRERGVGQHELKELASSNPELAAAVIDLYRAYRDSGANATEMAERLAREEGADDVARFPAEEIREFLRAHNNHFPELEAAAEALHESGKLQREEMFASLRAHLQRAHGAAVAIVPVDVMPTTLRRFDRHRNRVLLSEMLTEAGRVFHLAIQVAVLEQSALLDRLTQDDRLAAGDTRRLCRITLANYFAAALMMPYERFLAAAESLRYGLTTLQRPSGRGVPFFLIRVDNAGNVSKRFSATSFQFARLGGACPRWNVHDAFQRPGRILSQVIQMPDGATYFSIARTVTRPGAGAQVPDQLMAIGLGCEISHARRIVYADAYDLESQAAVTPIGVNCRLCLREDCNQRAFPPMNRPLFVSEHRREISPYAFSSE
jgi:XRE family transcriptional regulator, fatty acid utilization regulator